MRADVQGMCPVNASVLRKALRGAVPVAAAAVAMMWVGGGTASADALIGKTYSEAKSTIGEWGNSSVVSTVVGSQMATDDCLVTGWHRDTHDHNTILVSLNCNGAYASAGKAGNSAASPEGREALEEQHAIEWRATEDGHEWCLETLKKHPDWGRLEGCDYGDE